MVAGLLKACGLYLGREDELAGPAPDNVKGFREHLGFVGLNREILAMFGGDWDSPPDFPERWEFAPEAAPLLERAGELVARLGGRPVWGWKDPRNSLTLPFWQRLIPTLKVVVCVRNPLEVAHSLFVRGDATGAAQFRLWLEHHRRLLASAPPERRLVTHYQSYFEDARAELARVAEWCGLDVSGETIERACADIDKDVRHHRATTDALREAGASGEVVELYRRLCDEAGPVCRELMRREGPDASADGMLSRASAEALTLQLMRLDNQLARGEERLRRLEQQSVNLELRLHELKASLLPVVRALDALRALRNRLRALLRLGRG